MILGIDPPIMNEYLPIVVTAISFIQLEWPETTNFSSKALELFFSRVSGQEYTAKSTNFFGQAIINDCVKGNKENEIPEAPKPM